MTDSAAGIRRHLESFLVGDGATRGVAQLLSSQASF